MSPQGQKQQINEKTNKQQLGSGGRGAAVAGFTMTVGPCTGTP